MANATTHYDTLCVDPSATPDEIKIAWRKLLRAFHPDTAGDAGVRMTQKLNAAFTVIGSPDSRRAYDRDLAADREPVDEPVNVPVPAPAPQTPVQQPPTAPTAPTTPTAATGIWDAERYRLVRKISRISWAVMVVGLAVAAIALHSSLPTFLLLPIGAAAILTGASRELKMWRVAVLGLTAIAGPLAMIGVPGLSAWAGNAGPVAMTAQAAVAIAAFAAHSVNAPLRSLRAAKPRK